MHVELLGEPLAVLLEHVGKLAALGGEGVLTDRALVLVGRPLLVARRHLERRLELGHAALRLVEVLLVDELEADLADVRGVAAVGGADYGRWRGGGAQSGSSGECPGA